MKKIIGIFLSGILLVSFNSCKKDPVACATADNSSVLTGETIAFTNCSENSVRIAWDFGDGSTDEGNDVSHSYVKSGTYLVKMTAYSKKDKDWDRTSMLITVTDPPVPGKRFLTRVVLKGFEAQNGGSDWDSGAELIVSGPEPDIQVRLELGTGEWSVSTSTLSDATTTSIPKTWEYSPQNIYMSSVNWNVIMNETDALGSQEMVKWTINPGTATAANGVISLVSGANAIDIYFEERQ